MIPHFFIAWSLLISAVISQDLYAMNKKQKKQSITMNKNNKKEDDNFCEAICLIVGSTVCGGLGFFTAVSSGSYLEGAELPSQAVANLFEQSTACAFIGMGLGKIAYCGFECCKKIKQD